MKKKTIAFVILGMMAGIMAHPVSASEENIVRVYSEAEQELDIEHIPEELLTFLDDYPQVYDFVKDYPEKHDIRYDFDLTAEAESEQIPLLIQWDERWGYEEYGHGCIGYKGCGPVCMSMVALYLTDNPEYTPAFIASFADEAGYYIEGVGTSWDLMNVGCEAFGLTSEMLEPEEESIRKAMDEGCPVICSVIPGDFTKHGHFIVLAGYNEEGVYVNDPNSRENSRKAWSFERLLPQIQAAWVYRLA